MEQPDKGETADRKPEKTPDILHEFQKSFFSMSRLVSFPWTVSRNETSSSVFHVTIWFIQRDSHRIPLNLNVCIILIMFKKKSEVFKKVKKARLTCAHKV